LQDDGRLTDSKGRVVDFANTIVIMTSNIGAQYILRDADDFMAERATKRARLAGPPGSVSGGGGGGTTSEGDSAEVDASAAGQHLPVAGYSLRPETVAKVMTQVKAHFLPELLNRIDEVILFQPLSQGTLREIVRHQVGDMGRRLDDRAIVLRIGDDALDQILRESYNPSFGARPMRRYIEKHLATEISKLLISGKLADHSVLTVGVGPWRTGTTPAAVGHFSFTVSKQAPPA